jgi:hypothetical protein
MNTLLRLPLTLLELTAREGLKAAHGVLRLVAPAEHPDDVRVAPIAEPARVSRYEAAPVPESEPALEPAPEPEPDVAPSIVVRPPWSGYDSDSATEIAKRVRSADDATKAVVLLYEEHHKRRLTVLDAARA